MKVLGVEGAGGNWLSATTVLEGSSGTREVTYSLFESFEILWENHRNADLILVDVPIGLRNDGEPRRCDTEARKRTRRGSVFPTPSRLAASSYDEGYETTKRINERVTGGKSLSRQTYNILPLIHEVDSFLREHPEARGVVRESHPEVCFWSLNAAETVDSKKQTEEGYTERVEVLEKYYPRAQEVIKSGVSKEDDKKAGVSRDDFVDALALTITACGELGTLPENPPTDGQGLPMEMVYRKDTLEQPKR